MKMNLNYRDGTKENRALIAPHRSLAPLNYNCVSHSPCHHNHFQQMRPEPAIEQQLCPIWGKHDRGRWLPTPPQANQSIGLPFGAENGRAMVSPNSAWLSPHGQNNRQQIQLPTQSNAGAMNRAVFLRGSGGGGCGLRPVKRECAGTGVFIPRPVSESRKKPDLFNRNFQPMIYRAKDQQAQPGFPDGLVPNYDLLIARRNAAMAQQQQMQNIRAEVMMKHNEVMLPQEWTY